MRWQVLLRRRRSPATLTRLPMASSTCCLLARLFVLLAALAALAAAKRGCSAFGHSCFGGHGKRSDGGGGEQMPPELPALETLVFPAGDVYQPLLPPRGDPMVRRALALEKMPPALRQWFESVGMRSQGGIPVMDQKK